MCIRRQEVSFYLVFNRIMTHWQGHNQAVKQVYPASAERGHLAHRHQEIEVYLELDLGWTMTVTETTDQRSCLKNLQFRTVMTFMSHTSHYRKITSRRLWRWATENAGAASEAEFSLSGAQ